MDNISTTYSIDDQSSLCEKCNQIDFTSLCWHDRPQPRQEESTRPLDVFMGLVADIVKRSVSCKLCDLIRTRILELGLSLTGLYRIGTVEFCRRPGTPVTTTHRLKVILEQESQGQAPREILELQASTFPIPDVRDAFTEGLDQAPDALPKLKSPPFSARRLDSSKIDLNLCKQWLRLCTCGHGPISNRPQPLQHELLAIDVLDSCVRQLPNGAPYVALSYTWGRVDAFCHLIRNSELLQRSGSLFDIKLPQTVRDAMTVTRELGERYLWVDALCIIQDEERTKQRQLAQMGRIYGNAILTIIAASGTDANAGLAGVRAGTRNIRQHVLRLPSTTLVSVVDARFADGEDDYTVPDGVWITRAWTMQEQMFSSRCVAFTDKQVYWYCSHDKIYLEETVLETVDIDDIPRVPIKTWAPRTTLLSDEIHEDEDACRDKYQELVAMYSRRSLTYPSDALNAFAGFMDNLSKHSWIGSFLWGLPERPFSAALLWSVENQKRHLGKQRVVAEDGTVYDVAIPSWSWAAWNADGPKHEWIEYPESYLDYMGNKVPPEISFNRIGINGELVKVREVGRPEETRQETFDMIHSWKGPNGLDQEIFDPPNTNFIDSGRLMFCTSIATLVVRRSEVRHREGHTVVHHQALDRQNGGSYDNAFDIQMGSTDHLRGSGTPTLDAFPKAYSSKADEGLTDEVLELDFLVIGRSNSRRQYLSALVVEWRDGIAYRLGLAHALEKLWVTFDRQWRQVTLG